MSEYKSHIKDATNSYTSLRSDYKESSFKSTKVSHKFDSLDSLIDTLKRQRNDNQIQNTLTEIITSFIELQFYLAQENRLDSIETETRKCYEKFYDAAKAMEHPKIKEFDRKV